MNLVEKQKRIKEQRLIEATRKNLTGVDGKIGCILKYIAAPIEAQGGDSSGISYGTTEFQRYWEDDDEEGLPELDPEQTYTEIGKHFDGLSRGMHLEIKYMSDSNQITVLHKGHMVFCEIAGDLLCYVPGQEWENQIDQLFGLAKKIESQKSKIEVKENKLEAEREKRSLLNKLKTLWGI